MMDRTIVDLPCHLFGPVVRDWHLDVRGRAASDSVDGNGQVVYGAQPRWTATLDFNLVRSDRILAWRAIMAKMRGRVNLIRVCLCDPHAVTAKGITGAAQDSVPHSDGATHSDGTGYAYVPSVAVTADVAAGSSFLPVNPDAANGQIKPGQYVSVDDWLYMVTGIYGAGADGQLEVEPPLRRAVLEGDEVRLKAQVIMAFSTDAEGRAALDSGGRQGQASLQLVEWLKR